MSTDCNCDRRAMSAHHAKNCPVYTQWTARALEKLDVITTRVITEEQWQEYQQLKLNGAERVYFIPTKPRKPFMCGCCDGNCPLNAYTRQCACCQKKWDLSDSAQLGVQSLGFGSSSSGPSS